MRVLSTQEHAIGKYAASLVISFLAAYGGMAWQIPVIVVDIPFQFNADMNSAPAGRYEVQPNSAEAHIQLHNVKTDERYIVRVLTRLASRGPGQSLVAFDVEGQNHYLAEVHIAGIDGFALGAAKGKHTHITIPEKNRVICRLHPPTQRSGLGHDCSMQSVAP